MNISRWMTTCCLSLSVFTCSLAVAAQSTKSDDAMPHTNSEFHQQMHDQMMGNGEFYSGHSPTIPNGMPPIMHHAFPCPFMGTETNTQNMFPMHNNMMPMQNMFPMHNMMPSMFQDHQFDMKDHHNSDHMALMMQAQGELAQAQGEMLKTMGEIMIKYGKLLAENDEEVAATTPASQLSILSKNESGYAEMTAEQLHAAMEQKDFTLVNVHIPYEGHIPGTDFEIPFNDLEPHLDKLSDKDAAIVMYCKVGGMSATAAKALAELGYTNIVDVPGGFDAWKEAGYELGMNSE